MPTEFEKDMHDLVASVRAVSAVLIDPNSNPQLNMDLGFDAYRRDPAIALGVITQIASHRLQQIDRARRSAGLDDLPFPESELLHGHVGRMKARQACVRLLHQWRGSFPDKGELDEMIKTHGLVGFMQMVRVANMVGAMLADADPRFEDLHDLLGKEAIADEMDWAAWESE